MGSSYRPWGLLNWVLSRSPSLTWDFLGCLGAEERCLTSWRVLASLGLLERSVLWRVVDRPSRYSRSAGALRERWLAEFVREGGHAESVVELDILLQYGGIERHIREFCSCSSSNIVLDVTCFPKRFFFPIVKHLLRGSGSQTANLILTYSIPESYAVGRLAENCGEWAHLPSFSGTYSREAAELLVVNVGFDPMGLQGQIDHGESGQEVKLLLPFPASPRAVHRSWDFVRKIQKHRKPEDFELYLADAKDVSDAFDRLKSLTRNGQRKCELAPFGPKPISVAMCLFAILTDAEVFYTQPKVYNPEYSKGVAYRQGMPETYAYWVRLDGTDVYRLD